MSHPAMPPPPHPLVAPLPRRIRKVGAPLGVIIALGIVASLILILLTAVNPIGAALGFVLSSVAMIVVVLAYIWLDRFEPEPARLLVLAFVWGTSIAILVSVGLEVWVGSLLSASPTADQTGAEPADFRIVAIAAPVIEEAAKGLFLLLMMTGRRRYELNSLTDCLVYAGMTAVGFAWLEDIFYIAGAESLAGSLVTAAMRLIMAPFAHPLFTTMTAIGVYFALQQRNTFAKAGYILLGYAGAVVMHALWNGSALVGVEAYFGIYVLWMVPIFIMAIALGVHSRRREQRVATEKLPAMVAEGLVTPNEASWLGSIRNRKLAVAAAARFGGKPAGKAVRHFALQVVELAFVRDRIDRGFGDERVYALQNEEAYWVTATRAKAGPALQSLAGYYIPGPGR